MAELTTRGSINMQRLLDTIAMIIEKRENVKVTLEIRRLVREC